MQRTEAPRLGAGSSAVTERHLRRQHTASALLEEVRHLLGSLLQRACWVKGKKLARRAVRKRAWYVSQMQNLDALKSTAGEWSGESTLFHPPGKTETSPSSVVVTPVVGGRFARVDYTWATGGEAQEGSMLVGCEETSGDASLFWIDTWHTGPAGMLCAGSVDSNGKIEVRGSYPAGDGPDWGWRIVLSPLNKKLEITMFNVTPDGAEERAVEGNYARP